MTDDSDAPVAPVPSPSVRLRKLGFTLGVLFVAWLIFWQFAPKFLFPHSDGVAPSIVVAPPPEKIDNARIDALEARIKVLEDAFTAQPAATPADDARLAKIEAALAAVKEQLNQTSGSAKGLAALAAFGQLKEAALHGEDIRHALEQVKTLAQDNSKAQEIIATLSPLAEKGIAPLESLKASFAATLPRALASSSSDFWSNVQSLVVIRKIGETQQGPGDDAVVARAEAKLNRGDIGGALQELSTLSPQAAVVFAPWIGQAQTAVDARAALNALEVALSQDKAG